MKQDITAYCLDWHLQKSSAFVKLVVEPLSKRFSVQLQAWDGERLPGKLPRDKPTLFCMLPPPLKLLRTKGNNIVWVPMWDQAQGYDDTWWSKISKDVKIVAFSDAIQQKAQKAGLPVIKLKFFVDPSSLEPVSWQDGNVLFYWNRVGLVGPAFLEKVCRSLSIKKIIYRPDIDPRIDRRNHYNLPNSLNGTKVQICGPKTDFKKYMKQISDANVVIAPRATEGVGLVFLESMARGCTVIAYDSPTMNEYIINGSNGVLLNNNFVTTRRKLTNKLGLTDGLDHVGRYLLSDNQPWKHLSKLNLQKLGESARKNHEAGFQNWLKSYKSFIEFIDLKS